MSVTNSGSWSSGAPQTFPHWAWKRCFPNACLLSNQLTSRQKQKGSGEPSTSSKCLVGGGGVISASLWKRISQGRQHWQPAEIKAQVAKGTKRRMPLLEQNCTFNISTKLQKKTQPCTQVLTSGEAGISFSGLLSFHLGADSYRDPKWKELGKCWALPLITCYRPGGGRKQWSFPWVFPRWENSYCKIPMAD